MDASRILDAMLKNTRETGGESSERYTTCAISDVWRSTSGATFEKLKVYFEQTE
ncbi:hypothetical protein BDR05DRAFT_964423, partial [Suillus weaverae]